MPALLRPLRLTFGASLLRERNTVEGVDDREGAEGVRKVCKGDMAGRADWNGKNGDGCEFVIFSVGERLISP